MSESQRNKGVLKILSTNSSEFEQIAFDILKNKGFDISELNEDYKALECLNEEFYEEYIVAEKVFAEIVKSTKLGVDYDFCELTDLGNREYSFHTMFYNGGTCMSEKLADELDKLF